MRKIAPWLILLAAGCGSGAPELAPPEPPVVTVANPVERSLEPFTEFTGYLKAAREVELKAEVNGLLTVVAFPNGGLIYPDDEKGIVLFEIDNVKYKAALEQAKADVRKAENGLAAAKQDVTTAVTNVTSSKDIYARAVDSKAESAQKLVEYKANWDAAQSKLESARSTEKLQESQIDAAKAAQASAQRDFDNCTIRAFKRQFITKENKADDKIAVRISAPAITDGNYVNAGQTSLAKLYSANPIYAYWDVDEMTSLMYRRLIYDDKLLPDPAKTPLKCWIAMKDEKGYPHPGTVNTIAPAMDRTTASREIRGVIENSDNRLSSGDSVRVKVEAGPAQKKITIPEIAIGVRQQQKFVYVIKDGKAEFRAIVVSGVREIEGVKYAIIEKGLSTSDQIVVNGLLRVRDGGPVTVK